MPNCLSHCGTISAVTSIWFTMYRRNRLCRYRSTTSRGTESDCGKSPSLQSRARVSGRDRSPREGVASVSDLAMDAHEDERFILFKETTSDMLAERAWPDRATPGDFFAGLPVGLKLTCVFSAGALAKSPPRCTRTVPSKSMRAAGRLLSELCVAAGMPADASDAAGGMPMPRARSTPTPSACAGSAAVAASASTASAFDRSPGSRVALA
mmetsp:Transcript_5023/g.20131  ORF Transcript_5023/g.20131 Transcript_5023/m.20131 type:complete len:210 (+) Transcript_5023:1182-1811(+)